jgi:hypothetical protein
MTEKRDDYPLAVLHAFLTEASKEFRRFRFQAKVNLICSIILLLFLSRFLIFVLGNLGPAPFHARPFEHETELDVPDLLFLFASLVAVLWSLNVWLKQRRFVSRWGKRFEKLEALEKQFLPDEKT